MGACTEMGLNVRLEVGWGNAYGRRERASPWHTGRPATHCVSLATLGPWPDLLRILLTSGLLLHALLVADY